MAEHIRSIFSHISTLRKPDDLDVHVPTPSTSLLPRKPIVLPNPGDLTLLSLCLQKATDLLSSGDHPNPEVMKHCQELIPDIKFLLLQYLCNTQALGDASLSYLLPNTAITSLIIPRSNITDQGMLSISMYCKGLQELDIRDCRGDVTNKGLLYVAEACTDLKVLNISLCKNITANGLVAALQHLPKLVVLSIRRCTLNMDELKGALPKYCPMLRQLELNASFVHLEFLNDIAELEHLQWLDLGWCKEMPEAGLINIAHKRGPALEVLNVECCTRARMGDNFISALAQNCPNLKMLSLNNLINLSKASILEVATLSKNLTAFHISGCMDVTDDVLITLANNNPQLELLSIAGLPLITEASLLEIAKKCPNIEYIDLANCANISAEFAHQTFGSKVLVKHPATKAAYIPFKVSQPPNIM